MKLNEKITEDVLDRLGFSDYDDENCTWGNRRLRFGDAANWYVLQIIDYGDYLEENGRSKGFVYASWFELIDKFKPKTAEGKVDYRIGWDLNTVKDIYKIIYLYHKEWLGEFKDKLGIF